MSEKPSEDVSRSVVRRFRRKMTSEQVDQLEARAYDCGAGCGETHVLGCSHWDPYRTYRDLAESCTHCDSDCKNLVAQAEYRCRKCYRGMSQAEKFCGRCESAICDACWAEHRETMWNRGGDTGCEFDSHMALSARDRGR